MRVSGVGNPSARILFVSDAPTEFECRLGRPLLGSAGEEFDCWLSRTCRLHRDDVWVTVLQREFSKKDREATSQEVEDLWFEIMHVNSAVVVPFGAESTRLLLGPWASMDLCYGLPHLTNVRGYWGGVVVPIPHPGGVQYNHMVEGFEQLAKYLRGEIPIHTVDTSRTQYHEIRDENEFCFPFHSDTVLAIDTEGSVENPWCLTFSVAETQGWLIRRNQPRTLAAFLRGITEGRPMVVMHYAPHDLRVLEAMGVTLPPHITIYDTMQLAYISGRLPQGLKTLAYRLCGMRMRDYEDLIAAHDERVARDWLFNLLSTGEIGAVYGAAPQKYSKKNPDLRTPEQKAFERQVKALGRFAMTATEDPLHKRWENSVLPERLGIAAPMPHASLDDVPFSEVLQYACADADATRRVFLKMREMFDAVS